MYTTFRFHEAHQITGQRQGIEGEFNFKVLPFGHHQAPRFYYLVLRVVSLYSYLLPSARQSSCDRLIVLYSKKQSKLRKYLKYHLSNEIQTASITYYVSYLVFTITGEKVENLSHSKSD